MSAEPVDIEIRWEQVDLDRLRAELIEIYPRRRAAFSIACGLTLPLVLSFLFAFGIVETDFGQWDYLVGPLAALVVLVRWWIYPWQIRWRLRRLQGVKVRFVFDDRGMRLESKFGIFYHPIRRFRSWVEDSQAFLCRPSKWQIGLVPKHCLQESECERVRAWFAEHIPMAEDSRG